MTSPNTRKWSQLVPALAGGVFTMFLLFILFSATIGAFGCGTVLAWPAPALDGINSCDDCQLTLTLEEGSWVAATAYIGCLSVGPFAGFAKLNFNFN